MRSRLRAFMVVAGTVAAMGLAGAGTAAAAGDGGAAWQSIPAPKLQILKLGKVFWMDSARARVVMTCFGGAIAHEMMVEFTQDSEYGTRTESPGVECDGQPHVVHLMVETDSGDRFSGGLAKVTVRLTVLHPRTRKPLPPVTAQRMVYLRPPASATVDPGPVWLDAQGNATVTVVSKCQKPWVSQGLSIEVRQEQPNVFGDFYFREPRCNGGAQTFRMKIVPDGPFLPGPIVVRVTHHMLDPWMYDPVGGINRREERVAAYGPPSTQPQRAASSR